MAIKFFRFLTFTLACFFFQIDAAQAKPFDSQVVQIDLRLQTFVGHPSWLLILKDNDSQQVYPYIYDVQSEYHTWLAFSYTHNFQIIASELSFGPFAKIHNFCHLENLKFHGESLNIVLNGSLTPVPDTSHCLKQRYQDYTFPLTNPLFANPSY